MELRIVFVSFLIFLSVSTETQGESKEKGSIEIDYKSMIV